jgi:NAD(P)-dependent dehydrogenase (short-subunit alcohol dehydrogenase family)
VGRLDGRVAVVTGAGRGIGREHALLLASEGAQVVINDLGGATDGEGSDRTAAELVAAEIEERGGTAVANGDDVADWEGGQRLIAMALETFGGLHILVNNAGILRDRVLVNMTEGDWDSVMRVHLKGHFVPTRFAAAYWREQAKAGRPVHASVINTTSTSGLFSNPGQTNYGAAKSGLATFTEIAAKELARYDVRVNAIAPVARTRLTLSTPGLEERIAAPANPDAFDEWDPANISPLVAWMSTEECDVSGRVFLVKGGQIGVFTPWAIAGEITQPQRWTLDQLDASMGALVGQGRSHT